MSRRRRRRAPPMPAASKAIPCSSLPNRKSRKRRSSYPFLWGRSGKLTANHCASSLWLIPVNRACGTARNCLPLLSARTAALKFGIINSMRSRTLRPVVPNCAEHASVTAMMKRLLQGLACAAILVASGSVAIAADWKIARLTGGAWILAEGTDPVPAVSGMVVPKGSTVSTAQNGRVMLVHDQDTVLVGPNSLVGVPYRPDRGVSTTLVQQVGEVELAVQKRGRPHFSVQTPFLAAAVKGTEFTHVVSKQDATVRVDGGLVAVQDLRSGDEADIGAGQSATTRGGAALSVSGTG